MLSWSSGKDSAWVLHTLRQDPKVEVVGLITTFNESADRVAMHAVRRELVQSQALATGLPLFPVDLPWPCPNDAYEQAMRGSLESVHEDVAFDALAFGDLHLEDIRDYRERQMLGWGFELLFPIWKRDTTELSRAMISGGIKAILTCVDPQQCPAELVGRHFDYSLLADLPETADPCGENGEFHTFVYAAPVFATPILVTLGEVVERDGFVFADVLPNNG